MLLSLDLIAPSVDGTAIVIGEITGADFIEALRVQLCSSASSMDVVLRLRAAVGTSQSRRAAGTPWEATRTWSLRLLHAREGETNRGGDGGVVWEKEDQSTPCALFSEENLKKFIRPMLGNGGSRCHLSKKDDVSSN
jgi:hypothetical protein